MIMNKQKGSSLVVALVMLTIITLVAVYSIEGSTIQSKMVASSLFSSLTYQECRNEQEASIRYHNANNGSNRTNLLSHVDSLVEFSSAGDDEKITTFTPQYTSHAPKSTLTSIWKFLKEEPAARAGYEVNIESQSRAYLYENTCTAVFRFSTNSQTLGVIVEGLEQTGKEI